MCLAVLSPVVFPQSLVDSLSLLLEHEREESEVQRAQMKEEMEKLAEYERGQGVSEQTSDGLGTLFTCIYRFKFLIYEYVVIYLQ